MTYGKVRVIVIISKSSFFSSKEQKRIILRGYCREDKPKNVYWALSAIRGQLVVRGQGNVDVEVWANR